MLKSQDQYKYLNKFYKDAVIEKKNIIVKKVDVYRRTVIIFVVEKEEDNYVITKGSGMADSPIPKEDISQVVLYSSELEMLKRKVM
jgi:hypothetical protein